MSDYIIGIDLGTTNSSAAVVVDNEIMVIPYKDGHHAVPSVLNISPAGKLIVGQQAKRRSATNPENTIFGAKRLMGRLFDTEEMSSIRQHFHYDIFEGEHHEPLVQAGDSMFSLEEVSALILNELKFAAQEFLEQEVTKAVISVPAYFTQRQRQSVREAGKLAELEVLAMVNEPTAAALAVGTKQRWGKRRVLVYDLGGGTFDVSILLIQKHVYKVIGTCGNSFLGGMDFDNLLIDLLCEEAIDKMGIDIRDNLVAQQRLRDAAEKVKIELSDAGRSRITLPFLAEENGNRVDFDYAMTRPEYERMSIPLVKSTLSYVQRALKETGLKKKHIDEVILVGGMTRMPLIQKTISSYFEKQPCSGVDPDTTVASGAAALAYAIQTGRGDKILRDILSVSIGLAMPDGKFKKVIHKNTSLPVEKSFSLKTTKESQDTLKLRVFQGESRHVDNNQLLGDVRITGLPPMPKGKVTMDITFKVDRDSVLSVTAKNRRTGKVQTTTLVTDGLVHRSRNRDSQEGTQHDA